MIDSTKPNTPEVAARSLTLCPDRVAKSGTCHALLIEPAMTSQTDSERLLCEADYCVTSVRDVREVFNLRFQGPIALAVLNDLLGPFGLRAAAESVRRLWPLAKILIIGSAVPVLEDHLYDETISHRHEKDGFSGVLAVLQMSSQRQSLIGGYAGYRRAVASLSESDPSKEMAHIRLHPELSRNTPAGTHRMRANG